MNLAFYGTLRDPDILNAIVGKDLESSFHKSISVKGWVCLRIEGVPYPLLRSNPTASTVFHLYHDCSEVSWRRLVAYEGSDYDWVDLTIEDSTYRVFMADPLLSASDEIWDLKIFQDRDKAIYQLELDEYRL
jgi:hypothetical protein